MKNKFKFLEGMRSIAIIAFVIMLGFPIMAFCQDRNSIVGTWTGSYEGISGTIVFNSNGTGTLTQSYNGESEVEAFTWTQSGNTVRFVLEYNALFEVTYNGGNTFVIDDITFTRK